MVESWYVEVTRALTCRVSPTNAFAIGVITLTTMLGVALVAVAEKATDGRPEAVAVAICGPRDGPSVQWVLT
jgi:hypothetical protein